MPSLGEMCEAAVQQLFEKVSSNPNHMLLNLLPPPTVASQNYNLRPRTHDRHCRSLNWLKFSTRLLHNEIYWHHNFNQKNNNIRNVLLIHTKIIVVYTVAIRLLKLQYVNFYIKRIRYVMLHVVIGFAHMWASETSFSISITFRKLSIEIIGLFDCFHYELSFFIVKFHADKRARVYRAHRSLEVHPSKC